MCCSASRPADRLEDTAECPSICVTSRDVRDTGAATCPRADRVDRTAAGVAGTVRARSVAVCLPGLSGYCRVRRPRHRVPVRRKILAVISLSRAVDRRDSILDVGCVLPVGSDGAGRLADGFVCGSGSPRGRYGSGESGKHTPGSPARLVGGAGGGVGVWKLARRLPGANGNRADAVGESGDRSAKWSEARDLTHHIRLSRTVLTS